MRCRVAVALGTFVVTLVRTNAQACSNTCPPLDSGGSAVTSLCPGDDSTKDRMFGMSLSVCHPPGIGSVRISQFVGPSAVSPKLLVISNYFTGCNAGRREANVFSYASTIIHEKHPNVIFLSSLKGGGSCANWASMYERDGAVAMAAKSEGSQPLTIDDQEATLRDAFFTAPYPHPSYVIVDAAGIVREKFTGPCCGYSQYYDCGTSTAMTLNETLHAKILPLLAELNSQRGNDSDCILGNWTSWSFCECDEGEIVANQTRTRLLEQSAVGAGTCGPTRDVRSCNCTTSNVDCDVGTWSEWSNCSVRCDEGQRYRTREVVVKPELNGTRCPILVEMEACVSAPCQPQCVPQLGKRLTPLVVASSREGLNAPRAVVFTPAPGRHLGNFSSGRRFSTSGEEAWVANGHGHSITIVTGIGEIEQQNLTRLDRGYYHYLINITALSFNSMSASGRDRATDTFAFFATCQDNNNTYLGTKEANFFMGPSLYSSSPEWKNLVRNDGGPCSPGDECFLLHTDMLHESPSCRGIVHDPEIITRYGSVYWAVDCVAGQLVRYDFQQPHGPGLMDHTVAAVRRYVDVNITCGPPGVHMGMVVDAAERTLYIANAGSGEVIKVLMDTGKYARTAREEYPIFSSRLPSFEYSIYMCATTSIFASGLQTPSGLALKDGMLFVAEFESGNISVFDVLSGSLVNSYETIGAGLMGLAFAPESGRLHGVNALTNQLLEFSPQTFCDDEFEPYLKEGFILPETQQQEGHASCAPNATMPNSSLFVQVHVGTGYADDNEAVQDDSQMDESSLLLANRTDCEFDSDLNFDALLLGGYLCHQCLPDNCHDNGRCSNIQFTGYLCDNEFRIGFESLNDTGGQATLRAEPTPVILRVGRTYRFIINVPGNSVHIASQGRALTESVEHGIVRFIVDGEANQLPDALVASLGASLPISVIGGNTSTRQMTLASISTAKAEDNVTRLPSSTSMFSSGVQSTTPTREEASTHDTNSTSALAERTVASNSINKTENNVTGLPRSTSMFSSGVQSTTLTRKEAPVHDANSTSTHDTNSTSALAETTLASISTAKAEDNVTRLPRSTSMFSSGVQSTTLTREEAPVHDANSTSTYDTNSTSALAETTLASLSTAKAQDNGTGLPNSTSTLLRSREVQALSRAKSSYSFSSFVFLHISFRCIAIASTKS